MRFPGLAPRKEWMRYIVEGRARGRWVAIGTPHVERVKADRMVELALESGMWEDARILVMNEERRIVDIIQ